MPQVVVSGNFVVDIIGKPLDQLPGRGQLALLDTLETHVGGNGPNTAGALGKLGGEVLVLGRVGEDLYGRFMLERLESWDVDVSGVVRDPAVATGVTFVPVDSTGERSFIHHFGANAVFSPADVDWDAVSRAQHFHFASMFILPGMDGEPAAEVLAEAKRRGLTTSVDVCWDRENRWMEALRPSLPYVDFMMPSEEEGRLLTRQTDPREMGRVFREGGCRAAVIKLGERGCYYSGPEGEFSLPAYQVGVRETTGAGDCFIAGFLYGRSQGWDLRRALRFANACGARAVMAVGGVTGLARAADVEAWARETPLRGEE